MSHRQQLVDQLVRHNGLRLKPYRLETVAADRVAGRMPR